MDEREANWPVTVKLLDAEQFDAEWMPENLAKAVKWLSGYLDQIPPEYRDAADIDIDGDGGYDGNLATITISYKRPPTNEEVQQRIAEDKARTVARMEQARALYEKLKAVFEKD